MKLSLGFSPCPNDTFIFDALVNKKIDTEGFEFEVMPEDVETLNEWAISGKLDITKLSFPAFFQSLDKYILLKSGSALGNAAGPILVSATHKNSVDVNKSSIAIPGIHTTANLLLSFAYPSALQKKTFLFSEIEDAVLNGKANLGVIIHENRFTYRDKGLYKVADLGEIWEEKMKLPIPLGGIAIKRNIDKQMSLTIDRLIRKSLEYAFANYPLISDYVKEFSQTLSENVMRQHIDLYVNNYSLDLGEKGKNTILKLLEVYNSTQKVKGTNYLSTDLFLT